jgi:hypothetical protein
MTSFLKSSPNVADTATSLSVMQALEKMMSKSHAQEVALLNHNAPVFLPWEGYIQSKVVPAMLLSALFLSIIHIIAYILLGGRQQQQVGKKNYTNGDTIIMLTPHQRHLISYRITNFVANTCLAIMGLYYWAMLPPFLPPHNTIPNGNEMFILGSFQLGYQLWALPVGFYLVHETPVMLFHHFAVILVSVMSTMFTNGFRYWTPYFYGIFEVRCVIALSLFELFSYHKQPKHTAHSHIPIISSSIPLAVMNAFKDHKDWMDTYPGLYLLTRALFAVSFLGVRVVHCSPRHVAYLIEHYYLWSSSQNAPYMMYMAIVWICSAFLLLLNLYWGIVIVKGLIKTAVKMLFPKSSKQKSE